MKITIDTNDVARWGYSVPYYLAYIKKKKGIVTIEQISKDLGYSYFSVRSELDSMAKRGLIKKHYEHREKGGRAKLVGVEIIL